MTAEPIGDFMPHSLTMYDHVGKRVIRMTSAALGKLSHAMCQARSSKYHEFVHNGVVYVVLVDTAAGAVTAPHEPIDGELAR